MFDDGLGYHIYWQVLNTKNYGIPQNRERIFIVGFKDFRDFSYPKPTKLKLKLGDMLQDNPNSKYYLSDKTINRISNSRNKTKFKNQNSQYSGCLIAEYGKIPSDGTYIRTHSLHPRKGDPKKGGTGHLRRLTPLECWRLQGFKDNDFFSVKGLSDTQLYKQAGNSITVNVLMELFKKIYANNNK